MSIKINRRTMEKSSANITLLEKTVAEYARFTFYLKNSSLNKFTVSAIVYHCRMRDEDANKLKEEYQRLVDGLKDAQAARETDVILANPILPDEVLDGKKNIHNFKTQPFAVY